MNARSKDWMAKRGWGLWFAACIAALVVATSTINGAHAQSGKSDSVKSSRDADDAGDADEAEAPPPAAAKIGGGSLFRMMVDGGPLMWPIAGCSIVLLVFVFERFISLRRARVIPDPFTKRILEQVRDGDLGRDAAVKACVENGSPMAEVFAGALKKWGRPAVEVEQAVIDAGERVTHDLRKYLRLFNGISQTAPLLGLLGTVLGMITSFNMIVSQNAMGRAEMLAGGIGESLLTTAGGLFVAIPALVAYLFFTSRVESLLVDIDGHAQQLVDMLSAESIEQRETQRANASSKRKAA